MKKALVLLLCLGLCGCATVVKGKYQYVDFDTYPTGAKLAVKYPNSEAQTFTTPAQMKLATGKEPYSVEINKEGYKSLSMTLDSRLSVWFYANIVGGPFALGTIPIDLTSGSAYTFRKTEYKIQLESVNAK